MKEIVPLTALRLIDVNEKWRRTETEWFWGQDGVTALTCAIERISGCNYIGLEATTMRSWPCNETTRSYGEPNMQRLTFSLIVGNGGHAYIIKSLMCLNQVSRWRRKEFQDDLVTRDLSGQRWSKLGYVDPNFESVFALLLFIEVS